MRIGSAARGDDLTKINLSSLRIDGEFIVGNTWNTKGTKNKQDKNTPLFICTLKMEGFSFLDVRPTFREYMNRTATLRNATCADTLFIYCKKEPVRPFRPNSLNSNIKQLLLIPTQLWKDTKTPRSKDSETASFTPHDICHAAFSAKMLSGMPSSEAAQFRWAAGSKVPVRTYFHSEEFVIRPQGTAPPLIFARRTLDQPSNSGNKTMTQTSLIK